MKDSKAKCGRKLFEFRMLSAWAGGAEEPAPKAVQKLDAFKLIKNVRDYCQQPPPKKLLMLVLATYCDRNGVCFPGNETLAETMAVSRSTIQRNVRRLANDGEIQILQPGGGNQSRKISLSRYLKMPTKSRGGGVTAMTRGVVSQLCDGGGVTAVTPEQPYEQPTSEQPNTSKDESTSCTHDALSVFKADLSGYSEKELELIDIWHRKLCAKDRRWFHVDKYTDEVSKALALWEGEPKGFAELCSEALKYGLRYPEGTEGNYDPEIPLIIPKRRTIVRLIWENY